MQISRKKQRQIFARNILSCFLLIGSLHLFSSEISREDLIVAYIYNFAKFTTWPQNTDKPNQLFIICVLNDELLFRKLQKLKSKKIHTKPIISRTLSTKEENIEQCHTLFIGNVSQSTLNDTIEYISHLPILTISDNKSFVNKGCVEFVPQEKSIQFSVNQTSLKRAHLEINARLLRLAKSIVD